MLDSERSDGVYRNQKKTHVIGLALARPSARFAHDGAWLHAGSLDIVLHFEKIKKAALSSAIADGRVRFAAYACTYTYVFFSLRQIY
jgi:hypothetical protein